ncbi:MAG: hypothetical protein QF383_06950 [Flavobacteriales bacterium]|jgi:hypothetical protein|nr:hypothetical protein [Flavobacteriales bacterium]
MMKKLLFLLFTLPIFGIAQNTVCFTIDPNPVNGIAFSGFTKYVDVLGCFFIVAESTIPDAKVLHAAAVAAELLDNNEDGIVDDPLIESQLQNEQAFMPIFSSEGSNAENLLFNNYNGNGASAVLYKNEMDPSQTGHWGDDATVEEVIHTINHVGHTNIYPNAFSMQANSSLMSDAMDVARGGQFMTIPNPYPASAWYHYDDWTCDYECMMIEYIYWAIVSYMGILDDAQTAQGIANEWEPYNATLLQSTDILMYALITDTQYKLPLLAPDGNYCPNASSVSEINTKRQVVRVTDVLGRETKGINQPLFYIYDDGTVEKRIVIE